MAQQTESRTKIEVQEKDGKIFAPLKNKWLMASPEEKVRQEFIKILVNEYGYELEQMAQEVKVNNSKRGQGKARADIVIWRNIEDKNSSKSCILVVECKAKNIKVREEDYYQGYNYASWAGADFFITTNEKETKIFKVVKGEIPKKLEEVVAIPRVSDITNEKKLQELLSRTKAFTRDEFSKLLFKCHNIIRNNDKLSPEAAFDEISKILFMKIRYERREAKAKLIFSEDEFKALKVAYEKITGTGGKPFYQHLFDETKKDFADDEIFEDNDSIKVRENSFLQIVKELEKYNLSDTSDDIKGIAFEEFLGKTFRGELGQFFTPRTVVDYMVDILDPQEGETMCDPCCGSGGFLIKAFEYVREKIEHHIQAVKEEIKLQYYDDSYDQLPEKEQEAIRLEVDELFTKLNNELDLSNAEGRLRKLSYDCIFGTDANPRMARTAKMNMIMHGDGHGGVHHHDGLLNVNGIFHERFDIILTNPPFGARVEKTLKITKNDYPTSEKIAKYKKRYGDDYEQLALYQLQEEKPILDLFDLGEYSGLTEVLFMERCLNLLKAGGRMAVVLPEGVLNNSALQRIRDYIEGRAKIINITSIPQDVFIASGATVKPSLVFLKRFSLEEKQQYESIKAEETERIKAKYQLDIEILNQKFFALKTLDRGKKTEEEKIEKKAQEKAIKAQIKEIENTIEEEIKIALKTRFNYTIPMVEVEKAGISTTGAKIDNELIEVAKEYRIYQHQNQLWNNRYRSVEYFIPARSTNISRILVGEETPEYSRKITVPENF